MNSLANYQDKLTDQLYFSYRLNQILLHESDFETLIRKIISSLYSLDEFNFVWVLLFDKDLNFESFLSEGLNDFASEFQNTLLKGALPVSIQQVIQSGDIAIHTGKQPDYDLPIDFSTHSHIIKPLISNNNRYGLIGASMQTQSVWSENNYRFFSDLIDDISLVILRLKQSQDLKKIIDDAQDGFLIFDGRLNILDTNEAFCRISELNRSEIVGVNGLTLVKKHFSGANQKLMLKVAKHILNGKVSKPFEVLYKGTKVLSVTLNIKKLAQTRIAVVKDITDIRKGELAIKQNEEKFRNLVNALQDSVFIIQDGVIKLTNKSLCNLSKFTENELLGHDFLKFIAPEEKDRVRDLHQKRIKGKAVVNVYETIAYTKHGYRIPVEVSVTPVEFESKPAWQVVLHDITEQRKVQANIEKAHNDLEKAQQIGNMGSWMFDMNNFNVTASEQTRKIYGLDKDLNQFDLQTIQSIPLPEYRHILDQALSKLMAGEEKYDVEFKIKNNKTGQILDIHSIAEYNAETNIVSGIIQDITAKKGAEDELKQTLKELYNAQKLANIGSWSIDLNKRQVFASEETRNIYGFESEEFVSPEAVQEVHLPGYREKLDDALNKLIKGEAGYNEQFELKNKKTGEIFYIHAIAEYDKDKNLIKGVLRNITKSKRAEQELKEIATNFSNIFNVNQDTICILDTQGKITEVNQTFIDRMEYKREELLGQTISIIDKNVSDEWVRKVIDEILVEQKTYKMEAIHTTRSGKSFPVEVHSNPIIYNGNKSILSVARDITERVRNYQILEENEEKFRSIFENKGTASAILDEEGYIVLANDQCVSLSGYSREEIENGMSWMSLVHPDDYAKMAEQQRIRSINPKDALQAYEVRMISKNDEVKHVLINVGVTKKRQRIASFVDITERKKAEESLREQKNFLWLLVDNMPIQIFWKNRDFVYKGGNLAFAKVVGLSSAKKVKGKTDQDFARRSDYNEDYRRWETEVMESGTPMYNHEESYFKADGTQGIALTSRIPLLNNRKNIEGVLVFSMDITERKENEQELLRSKTRAEESDRLKSAFLATVSHELRTPLNHILGFSDLIPELTDDREIIEFSKYINKSGMSLLEIIDDIFNLAMIEQKPIKIRKNQVFIRDVFLDLKKFLQEAVSDASKSDVIKLNFNIEKRLVNQKVITDKPKIIQAVSNILKNAVKYTHQGSISLKVEMNEKQMLRISVADTGIGIPEDKLHIIFDFFRQGDDSHTREYGGVGIGLALARKIADAMDAHIDVSTKVGEGSVFIFNVPVSTITTKMESEIVGDRNEKLPNLHSKQILVVEDDVTSMELISILLKPLKCNVIKAWNGSEAVDVVRNNENIDLVFMDLKMPVMDGFLSTIEIRKINQDVPVVALTAHALSSEKKRALDSGCNDLITKPIKKNLLYELLEKILL